MTLLLLIRHAETPISDTVLVGRTPGIGLSPTGRRQAAALALRMSRVPLDAVYASPIRRARETAAPLARSRHLALRVREGLTEIDFGDWTGRTFEDLNQDPVWTEFHRGGRRMRIPGGETIAQAQRRMVATLEELAAIHAGARVAVVTHRDVIRLAVAHYAGLTSADIDRLEARYASVTPLRLLEDSSCSMTYGPGMPVAAN